MAYRASLALPQNETLLRNKDDFNVDMFEVATTTRRPLVAVMVVALEELGSVAKLGLTLQCVLECVGDAWSRAVYELLAHTLHLVPVHVQVCVSDW